MVTLTQKDRNFEIDDHIARKIRALRKERGLSQTELGNMLGISFQQVQKYEKATNRVSCSTLWNIAEALDAPIAFFFPKERGERVAPALGIAVKNELLKLTQRVASLADKIAA